MPKQTFTVGVDARSLLCKEPRGEGKSLLRLYSEIATLDPALRMVFFGDERVRDYKGNLPDGVKVVSLSSRGHRYEAWENFSLPLSAWRQQCDVLHCTGSGGPLWSPIPILMTVHDLIPLLVDDGQSEGARKLFRRRLNWGLRQSRFVVAVSGHTRADLCRSFPHIASKIHVVHWGAPHCLSAQTSSRAPATGYLLVLGGASPRKNTEYSLKRFAGVAGRHPQLSLVIAGVSDAVFRSHLLETASALGVSERVHMPGFVTEHELSDLMRGASGLLYLSRYEGFGLPLLEACAAGVPVVASDSSSIPEVLGDPQACLPLADTELVESTIDRVVGDAKFRAARLALQGQRPALFDWRITASQTLALLKASVGRV